MLVPCVCVRRNAFAERGRGREGGREMALLGVITFKSRERDMLNVYNTQLG